MTDEREAMGSHEAREQPVYDLPVPAATSAADDSLQALTRDLENAGHPRRAARLAILTRNLDPYLLPQMPVSAPVPEPRLPETAMVELTECVEEK